MKKIAFTWLTVFAVIGSGLLAQAEEEKKDEERRDPPEKRERPDGDKERGDGDRRPEHPMAARIFNELDENEDGVLGVKEFAKARPLSDKSRREIGELFKRKDLNDDGEIDKREFVKTFNPPGPGRGDKGDRRPPKGARKGGKGGKGGR